METYEEPALEAALQAAVLAGDERAWRVLYDAYFHHLYAYVHYRTGRDAHRTEEILQECWMIAVRRIASFRPDQGSFGQWLCGIANHTLRNAARKHFRREEHDLRLRAEPASTSPAPLASEQIAAAYAMLPYRQRAVLRAKYELDYSVADIAREWGESQKAIESLLSRARRAFREAFLSIDSDDMRTST